ncbi:hypothetical protein [Jeotgalibacillus sp. S-D1]|uniref:hypothetical protein n=1 Tax=Jeotgalibacillus sp. S-D1 TaxID=2552189 RepID=UPI00105A91DB|nr:hypothetical protein [Jeotgalibacillus sp. S-D1]
MIELKASFHVGVNDKMQEMIDKWYKVIDKIGCMFDIFFKNGFLTDISVEMIDKLSNMIDKSQNLIDISVFIVD